MGLQLYNVAPRLPESLNFLEKLADNIWWCWHADAVDLFTRIDHNLWREVGGNAKAFLRHVSPDVLEELAGDSGYLQQIENVRSAFEKDISSAVDNRSREVAYFSLEYGIHESIPIFSGGLGVLAGDHLKAASDMKLPLVAVGLLYRQGYFRQVLDRTGFQTEHYPVSELHELPIVRGCNPEGDPVTISMKLADRELFAAVWVLWVGNVPLLLLDTELPQNSPDLREVTWRLYGGDKRMRLHQELLLGIGGVKALLAMGFDPQVCHMNEGHAGFLSLARLVHLVRECHLEPDVALEVVWRSNIFTTHTPVPAGNEVFDINMVRPYLAPYANEAGFDIERVIRWGIPITERDHANEMSMTVFGLRMAANFSNGVSKLHGEVARQMWKHLWPERSASEIPIGHITNGVHINSWISPRHGRLYNRYLSPGWMYNPPLKQITDELQAMPDDELWGAHELCRQSLIRYVRRHVQSSRHSGGNISSGISLQPDVLTIGFARRFATYKRGTLLLRNKERLLALLRDKSRPVQFIFAGKAHPADNGGKQLIKELIDFARAENVQNKLLFLENDDIGMARYLVQGVDVWLNTPRRPQEASGTSGMKAAINGVINCSILDGWWAEAYDGVNGWAIEGNDYYTEDEDRDNFESQQLFNVLENEVIPCFYERIGGELPLRWIARMKASIATGLGFFSSARMVSDYDRKYYKPAADAYGLMRKDNASAAKNLVMEKGKLVENFYGNRLYIGNPVVAGRLDQLHVGDKIPVTVEVYLGGMLPGEVEVDAYSGVANAHNEIVEGVATPLTMVEDRGNGNYLYGGDIICRASGRFGLTARIKAAGNAWDNSVPGFMCWPK